MNMLLLLLLLLEWKRNRRMHQHCPILPFADQVLSRIIKARDLNLFLDVPLSLSNSDDVSSFPCCSATGVSVSAAAAAAAAPKRHHHCIDTVVALV